MYFVLQLVFPHDAKLTEKEVTLSFVSTNQHGLCFYYVQNVNCYERYSCIAHRPKCRLVSTLFTENQHLLLILPRLLLR